MTKNNSNTPLIYILMKIKLLAFGQIAEITGEQTELAADVCDTTELLQLLYE